ncbi:MAG: calcium/sodium antiporter [Duncaniella sp.]|nr:calcium/sodium antiporter [Duncaniella sp.]
MPSILLLIIGLGLVLFGANMMTDGSVGIARRFGMSDFMIGLTIVAMMTSAPELTVSVTSALDGSPAMAVGNIVGSNIFNILIIVGLTALINPITVSRGILLNELPLVILSSLALLAIGAAPWLDGGAMTITRVEGLLLLLFFAIFLRYTFASAKPDENTQSKEEKSPQTPLWRSILLTLSGLVALIWGGDWFVDGATGLARSLGWSEALIGLTILAAGTSLPELATSVAAALKGHSDLCMGNVIGSNIFNIFFVLGTTATISPLPFGGIGMLDLWVLTGASVLLWLVSRIGHRQLTVTRQEGAAMVALYIGYIAVLYTQTVA